MLVLCQLLRPVLEEIWRKKRHMLSFIAAPSPARSNFWTNGADAAAPNCRNVTYMSDWATHGWRLWLWWETLTLFLLPLLPRKLLMSIFSAGFTVASPAKQQRRKQWQTEWGTSLLPQQLAETRFPVEGATFQNKRELSYYFTWGWIYIKV